MLRADRLIWAGFIGYVLIFGSYSVMNYWSYQTTAFDLGLFAQIFHSMISDGSQFSTLERNRLLSHFAIHISPALYLLTPIFWLWPDPKTLLIVQTLLLAGGVFPLFRLANQVLEDEWAATFLSLSYLLSFGIHRANLFDFHEIALAVPLLFCSFYWIERKSWKLLVFFLLLVLLVKEEMPVVVFCVGIFIAVVKRKMALGALVAGASVLYYTVVVSNIFQWFGGAPMYDRYAHFMPKTGEVSHWQVLQTVLAAPGAIWADLLSKTKMEPFFNFLVRGAFLPLFSLGGLILLVPVIVINVMSSYEGQYQFQYHYAAVAVCLFFYGVILSLQNFRPHHRRRLCALVLFLAVVIGPSHMGVSKWLENGKAVAGARPIDEVLQGIPAHDSVWVTNNFAPQLSQRKALYLFPHKLQDREHVDWIVVDLRPGSFWPARNKEQYNEQICRILQDRRYGVYSYVADTVLLLKYQYPTTQNDKFMKQSACPFVS